MRYGYSPEEIYELFKKYSKNIKYINWPNIIKAIYGLISKRKIIITGLNSGIEIEEIIREACLKKGIKKIRDIKRPLIIPSTNLHNGEILVFHSIKNRVQFSDHITYIDDIDIGKAVRASCSYPGVFSPCNYKGIELVDGGLRDNVPWKETKKLGADKVLSIVFENELKNNCCDNIIEVMTNSLAILSHELSNYELEGADYLLKVKTEKEISLLDTKQIDYLYDVGYSQTKKQIKKIKELF